MSCLAAGECNYCGGAGTRTAASDPFYCRTCRHLAIYDPEEAERLYQQVITWANSKRFFDGFEQPPMVLYSRRRFGREFPNAHKALGMAQRISWETPTGVSAEAEKVIILAGLPEPLFQTVAAHELGHVWVASQHLMHLTPQEEEGLCETISHLWVEEKCRFGRDGLLRSIEQQQDAVYGEGFRLMKSIEQRVGLIGVMQLLVSRSKLRAARKGNF